MPKKFTSESGRISIEISDDAMSAWMTIQASGKLIDENEVLDLIQNAGIKFGIEEAIQKMAKEGLQKDYNTPFPIAICKANSSPQTINYHFESQLDASGKVDPFNLEHLTCVSKGTVLADFSFNLFDNEGSVYNVLGEMHSDTHFDTATIRDMAGDGVSFDEKNSRFIAISSGYPFKTASGKISIMDRVSISGPFVGKTIRTPISIEILSDVQYCNIASASNIYINGDLISSKLHCEGDLEVSGSITDCKEAFLNAGGNVKAKSIQRSRLMTRKKLFFTGEILNSQIVADGGVEGSASSTIHSGSIQASGSIISANIGNQDSLSLELEITIGAYLKNLLMIKTKELIKQRQSTEPKPELIENLNQEIKAMEISLDEVVGSFLSRESEEKLMVKAEETIYPNTQIRILKHSYQIKSIQQNAEFIEKD